MSWAIWHPHLQTDSVIVDLCIRPRVKPATENSRVSVDDASASISKLNLSAGTSFFDKIEEATPAPPATPAFECTCGMPLCICEAPTPIAEVPYELA